MLVKRSHLLPEEKPKLNLANRDQPLFPPRRHGSQNNEGGFPLSICVDGQETAVLMVFKSRNRGAKRITFYMDRKAI